MLNGAGASVGPENDGKAEKPDEEADGAEDSDGTPAEDDKLYCVCKTKYDEDRFMIACDRCDEWYHTNCLHMSDLEVDLVDQFICPPCVERNPHLHLRTTYKQRCLYGLRHPDPNSSKACHKAARGAFSKYCSDECGVKYMQSRIDTWAKKGGKPENLWESVKGADKREGVVCAVESDNESSALSEEEDEKPTAINGDAKHSSPATCPNMDVDAPTKAEVKSEQKPDLNGTKEKKKSRKQKQLLPHNIKTHLVPPSKSKVARETERLNDLLDSVLKLREELKRGMEIVVWRERLLQLATERAEMVDQCGWDQRLCMDDQEWEDSGAAAMESYEDLQAKAEAAKEQGSSMEVDGAEEQWWCPGNKVCSRHQGWQTVRYKDIAKEKEKNDEALSKLTTREREIRKRIEDMLDPQKADTATTTPAATSSKEDASSRPTLKATNKAAVNGHSKAKAAATSTDATSKKGKKRKAPTA
jgi:COMPASS component SPP1